MSSSTKSLYAKQSFYVRSYVAIRLSLGLIPARQLNGYLPDSGTIADIGCGYGVLANELASMNNQRNVMGIDADPVRIEVATATVGQRSNIQFACQDAASASLPELSGAVMVDFLHHLKPPAQAGVLESVAAALQPGGVMVIREVNPVHNPRWKYWMSVAAELVMYPSPKTVKLQNLRPQELTAKLSSLGMQVRFQYADGSSPFAAVLYVATKKSTG